MGQHEIVIMRAGHYFTPTSGEGEDLAGSCQGATVAHVVTPESGGVEVNLDVLTHSAVHQPRLGVSVEPAGIGTASFHLTRDCPWGK